MGPMCVQHGGNYVDECEFCKDSEVQSVEGESLLGVHNGVFDDEMMDEFESDFGSSKESALNTQVGGDHYKNKAIQPVQYCMANGIGFMEGSVIKYVSRWRDKGGIQDLEKARHFLDLLIEYEKEKGA